MDQQDPFIGRALMVYENGLHNRGTVLGYHMHREVDEVIVFYTEKGKYSFYRKHPEKPSRNLRQLRNGDWKMYGDGPRWAYVKAISKPNSPWR